MKALIDPQSNNRICEIVVQEFPISEPLFWVDCPDNVTPTWSFDGLDFSQYAVIEETFTDTATYEQKLSLIRIERNKRLSASDWTQLSDAAVDKNIWAVYRQALRDLPENIINIDDVVYPAQPE